MKNEYCKLSEGGVELKNANFRIFHFDENKLDFVSKIIKYLDFKYGVNINKDLFFTTSFGKLIIVFDSNVDISDFDKFLIKNNLEIEKFSDDVIIGKEYINGETRTRNILSYVLHTRKKLDKIV